MEKVVTRIRNRGLSDKLVRTAYDGISPMNIASRTDPSKIQILYAKHDQLTPEASIIQFAEKWGVSKVHGYNESHASILINSQLYKDNKQFLDTLNYN